MLHVPKNKNWQPSASLPHLKERAILLAKVRQFFADRGVLEVETPLMCRAGTTDPFIKPIPVQYSDPEQRFFLQTSPEYAMKRLLAAGSGSIYQLCKAFRNSDEGRLHNPEFTLLEWYRLGFDHHDLMTEVEELLIWTLGVPKAERITYQALFLKYLDLDPHTASAKILADKAKAVGINLMFTDSQALTASDWLDLLLSHCIEPLLGKDRPVIIYDFPVAKAALAKIRVGNPSVAERFEVYIEGIELANGYHELSDPKIQLARFEEDCKVREQLGYPAIPIDEYLLEALKNGLPDSAGVALGFDRLMMLKTRHFNIQDVVSFTIDRV